jgi:exodeoxyribonuclease V beta subunit
VVTIHRSKGLEYPVVLCPFLWQVPSGEQGPRRLGVRWQPPGASDPQLDLHLSRHWGAGFAARRQQREAELAERERLAYVAATRARQLLVLAWGPAAGQQANPLQPWLFSSEPLGDADHDSVGDRSDADWLDRLQHEIAARQLPLAVLSGRGAPVHWQPPPASGPDTLALGPVPRHGFDSSWGRSSYTSWTRGSHGAAPAALEEGRETDGLVAELDLEPAPASGVQDADDETNGPLASFPRGAGAGDCLHRILEQFAFDQPAGLQAELVGRELERAGIAADQLAPLLEGLERLRLTPLGEPLERCYLAQVPQQQRLHEMGFDLPLALVKAAELAQAFIDHPGGPFGAGYGASLAQLPIASRGFLTGSIDLAFAQGQRWWVLDWKSNWLGERDAAGQPRRCGPRHYGTGAMASLMAANHYPLQAHLYLVALHRYLRWRLPGYDPATHLGGYVYVFLRGVPGPTTASEVPGVFVEQPPLQRLLALDRLLEEG